MNPLKSLVSPRYPPAAIGLSGESACAIQLDRRGGSFVVRSAAVLPLPAGLIRPGFDELNIEAPSALAAALADVTSSAGLARRRRWSVALPEASTRTSILTMETQPATRAEGEEMLRWKIERALGAPLDELRVSRERLKPDPHGRERHLVTAVRLSVLDEYEQVFAQLGWHAGLMLPRHMGEAWWLMRDGGREAGAYPSDSLLVSVHPDGFTAVILRAGQPLYVRTVSCESEDRADELYRFLLFYRDRNALPENDADAETMVALPRPTGFAPDRIGRLLVAGSGIDEAQASAVVEETLASPPRAVRAEELRLSLPSRDLDFAQIAAPAGLAALAWD
jgi:Tfp pilus assembly PilM family ATPase